MSAKLGGGGKPACSEAPRTRDSWNLGIPTRTFLKPGTFLSIKHKYDIWYIFLLQVTKGISPLSVSYFVHMLNIEYVCMCLCTYKQKVLLHSTFIREVQVPHVREAREVKSN